MPDGFIGVSALKYLGEVNSALVEASNAHTQNPFAGLSGAVVPFPPLPTRHNESNPHPTSTARSGSHTVGAGCSSNIVVSASEYAMILEKISAIDEDMIERSHSIATGIEGMCRTSYIVPQTVGKITEILDGIKSTMEHYRSPTTDTQSQISEYVSDIITV